MLLASLLPLVFYLIIGVCLRAAAALPGRPAESLLRLVFYVTLPALAFTAILDAPLGRQALFLPLLGFAIDGVCVVLAWVYATRAGLSREDTAGVVIGAGVANMLFVFPFILAALGPQALAAAVLFDLGNAVFNASVLTFIAMRYGDSSEQSPPGGLSRMLRTPLFVALVLAILFNIAGIGVPEILRLALQPLGAATIPLTLIALGLALDLERLADRLAAVAGAIRMGAGLVCGVIAVLAAGFDESTSLVILVAAAAPVGFSAVTFAAVAGADPGRAAAAVSLSVLAGLAVTAALLSGGRFLLGTTGMS